MKNPVMFVVWVGSVLTTILYFQALLGSGEASKGFILSVSLWLWFTVLFANFAEAIAEGRSKAQAASLRQARCDIQAKKLTAPTPLPLDPSDQFQFETGRHHPGRGGRHGTGRWRGHRRGRLRQ